MFGQFRAFYLYLRMKHMNHYEVCRTTVRPSQLWAWATARTVQTSAFQPVGITR
jgi:hypothetical protein